MKVLIYNNRKDDELVIDISTPEKEAAGYLVLFNYLDSVWDVYSVSMPKAQQPLYRKAKAGDSEAAKKLLNIRKNWEYEEFHTGNVVDPFVGLPVTV